ncbi:MFS transporter (plasmid) [Burkholderia sp. SFA1]|nr:MFS transporter [Burkholderia sp. SFA1]
MKDKTIDAKSALFNKPPDAIDRTDAVHVGAANESSPRYAGWRIVAAAIVGLLFSPGPMILLLIGTLAPQFERTYGWSIGQVMFGLTLFGIASLMAAPVAGRLTDRLGVRRVMLPSILLAAACLAAFGSLVSTLAGFYAVCFLFGFLGYGAQSLTYNKLITEWFDERRGLAIGAASAGLGLGYVTLPGVIGLSLRHYGASGTFYVMAAILVVLPFGVNFFCAVSPGTKRAGRNSTGIEGMTLSAAVRTPAFWLLALAILVTSAVVTGVVPQISKLTRDLGYPATTVTLISTGFGVVTLTVRLAIGWLLDRAFAPRIGALAFLLTGVGCALVASCVYVKLPLFALVIGVAFVGIGYGTESDLVSYLTSKYFGKKHFGAIYGCLIILFLSGVSIGPLMYGSARSMFGSYGHVFMFAAGMSVVSALTMMFLPPYQKRA